MITKYSTASEFHHISAKNADGTPLRARRNGATKTWKTRPNEFRIPAKHGLYDYFYIDQNNAGEWNEGNGYETTNA